MLRILRDRFVRLGRDEDGVALVTTLAVFMFMWLVCMGVYAIGTAVKTRIHLQNACDAAAYSAAVVQADALSRIATINRAMAWTYIAVTRRQMDWVTYRWLEEVCTHWQHDYNRARSWAAGSTAICSWVHPHHGHDWNCSLITLNGATKVTPSVSESIIQAADSMFLSGHEGKGPSFYASSSTTGQIMEDWKTIEKMGDAIDALKEKYDSLVESVIIDVVDANLPEDVKLAQNSPRCFFESMEKYTEVLPNSEEEEDRFLSFVRQTRQSAFGNSGSESGGANSWFVRNNSPSRGFRRGYKWGNSVLRANWTWYSYQWHCKKGEHGEDIHIGPFPCPDCRHPSHYRCSCTGYGQFYTSVYADNNTSRDDPYYETPSLYRARPNKLKREYFDKDGTITVGVAVENQNPWTPILGTAIKGIFSAFNIGGDLSWAPQYMVCIASAKAGYKYLRDDVENDTRAYRISWEDVDWYDEGQSWNLCQSDWDAVLIPVRRAETFAKGKGGVDAIWDGDVSDFLDGYLTQLADSSKMLAGGSKNMDRPEWKDGNGRNLPPDYYRFDQWKDLPDGQSWDWKRDGVDAQWQIENKNARIDWTGIQKVMFH